MYLKVNNKMRKYDLLGKNRTEIYLMMRRNPDEMEKEFWCYVLEVSRLKQTLLFIEFEDGIASHLSVRAVHRNPLFKAESKYIKMHVAKESL
ncbi:hypothetical protein [Chryseobacterium sp. R2ACT005]|uniref:hypothetical protein n=1 Tax=Chryseobacterium sp. R2ACT005 TaxID=3416668 RepID=UPI003CF5E89D